MALAGIPNEIDPTQAWLVDYWAGHLGVTSDAVRHVISKVGGKVSSIKNAIKDGYRISLVDDEGTERLVARVRPQIDGFSISVPYHSASHGMLFKIPYDYSKMESISPFDPENSYKVSARAKLSFHMEGFVQFSTAESKKIISGYNKELQQIKGIGLKSHNPISVSSGPVSSLKVEGMHLFQQRTTEVVERFGRDDLWNHPEFSGPDDKAFNVEFFLLRMDAIKRSSLRGGNRILTTPLPFNGAVKFDFDLRVLEFANVPFGLGVIVSRMCTTEGGEESGYSLGGPGCFDEEGKAFGICAWYPIPPKMSEVVFKSLDYESDSAEVGKNAK